jgi:hypothetical protein
MNEREKKTETNSTSLLVFKRVLLVDSPAAVGLVDVVEELSH